MCWLISVLYSVVDDAREHGREFGEFSPKLPPIMMLIEFAFASASAM